MKENKVLKLLFIVNPFSGSKRTDMSMIIETYFNNSPHSCVIHLLTKSCTVESIKKLILQITPNRTVAVGGDGTVKLVAECLMNSNIPLGIVPAGSANGLARELGIFENSKLNLDVILEGVTKKIHLVKINHQICIHLSDIGLNAYAMKKFSTQLGRGWWGYFIVILKVLFQNPRLKIVLKIDNKTLNVRAEMIVIANATQYGTGAIINPKGKLDDALFEVIVVKKVSIFEVFKMIFSHKPFDSTKTEVFQTRDLLMSSIIKVHFQIDGEYCGKVNNINATLLPDALEIIIPA